MGLMWGFWKHWTSSVMGAWGKAFGGKRWSLEHRENVGQFSPATRGPKKKEKEDRERNRGVQTIVFKGETRLRKGDRKRSGKPLPMQASLGRTAAVRRKEQTGRCGEGHTKKRKEGNLDRTAQEEKKVRGTEK